MTKIRIKLRNAFLNKDHSMAFLILLLSGVVCISSCSKFLDAKPDKKLSVPDNLEDLQLLLDNIGVMNQNGIALGEMACDDYYLSYEDWEASDEKYRDIYIWDVDETTILTKYWLEPYQLVFFANEALDQMKKIKRTSVNTEKWKLVKGSALFFRAYAFYDLTQVFTLPYVHETAVQQMGIPLRLTSDINKRSVRANLQETYDQIIHDFKEASNLLPATIQYKYRPSKVAAFGALARTYLVMGDYENAGKYADSALRIYNDLIDFNKLNLGTDYPITNTDAPSGFNENKEIVFYSKSQGGKLLKSSICKIDSLLYSSYDSNDLRKLVYFRKNSDNSIGFRGYYDGEAHSTFFNGITTDELYLIRAEALVRVGKTDMGVSVLNTLLINRYKTETFIPVTMQAAQNVLEIILQERRKELVFRGLRWTDLRRFSTDPYFALTVRRKLNGKIYDLEPGDPRYAFLIPGDVIQESGIRQNKK